MLRQKNVYFRGLLTEWQDNLSANLKHVLLILLLEYILSRLGFVSNPGRRILIFDRVEQNIDRPNSYV